MKIIPDFPPNYDEVCRAFNLRGLHPIFAWGEAIYNPHGIDVPPSLVAHERVHMERQQGDPFGWWRQYIDSGNFRLREEILAHAAELRHMRSDRSIPRNQRRTALHLVAQKLAHPLYGSLISVRDAKRVIEVAVT